MPALEQAQYELKSARQEILKLNKAIEKRDVLVSDVLRENVQLKQKLDRVYEDNSRLMEFRDVIHKALGSRSYLEELLRRFKNEEVD